MDSKAKTKSWFCVLNNPQDVYDGEPNEIAEKALEEWVKDHPTRTGAVAYCISADGLKHLHMVLEDTNMARFSALKKAYPKAHLEPTMGNKQQAEDYIQKRGKFEEKGEQVIYIARYGEIKGKQGARMDFDVIEELIEQGLTPNEVMEQSFGYRRYERMIKQAYFWKRFKETPPVREIKVYWHVGESGTGKSYTYVKLVEEKGEQDVYMYSDFETGGLDNYCGEPVLFMDEFRGQIQFSVLMKLLQGYKMPSMPGIQTHCRFGLRCNITSVLPPERVYQTMVRENRDLDTMKQLFRRINFVVYHYRDEDAKYREFIIPMEKYTDYETLREIAENQENDLPEFDLLSEPEELKGEQVKL